ncbi:Glucan endo-1,3-beta-glucosidase [Dorcoceras hygrometricum]|uniref:Glucan endo-1,3-beta-glucosidase n=1 Tax=Dorcoceras hygrometricum TaxID=472368 RepID=A0A2Z7CN92_9LAMI|nr:Glucan endo-1,3-beta-glucosidase [Dorcoceras hygrometricum]
MAKSVLTFLLVHCLVGVALSSRPDFDSQKAQSWHNDWCVAQADAPIHKMQIFIDYACGITDCSSIQEGGQCFKPNNVYDHASFALNQDYRRSGICNADIGFKTTVDPCNLVTSLLIVTLNLSKVSSAIFY